MAATSRSGADNVSGGNRKYRASKRDCQRCELKPRCCPKTPVCDVLRRVHEEARDHARQMADTPEFEPSRSERRKVEMLFAHLKTTLRFERMRLPGLSGARDEFPMAAHHAKLAAIGAADDAHGAGADMMEANPQNSLQ
ncbi:transposase [Allomesorhizobium camelthorni]|uniref:transposase n=1 Tax=Allomesorhizobium camelthorni TaxID=475069 RepID=UPI0031B58A6D